MNMSLNNYIAHLQRIRNENPGSGDLPVCASGSILHPYPCEVINKPILSEGAHIVTAEVNPDGIPIRHPANGRFINLDGY